MICNSITDVGFIGLEAAMDYCYYEECDCNWAWIDGSQFMFSHSSVHNPTQIVSGNLGSCGVLTNGEGYESQTCDTPRNYFCHFIDEGITLDCGECEQDRCDRKNIIKAFFVSTYLFNL